MAIKKIGIDLDGVVADFYKGYTKLATQKFGNHVEVLCSIKHRERFSTWKLEKIMNLEKFQAEEMIESINNFPMFYETLELLYPESWQKLISEFSNREDYEITFITSRKNSESVSVREVTKRWLQIQGWQNPSVVVTDEKVLFCKVLGIQKFVDDTLKNCLDVHTHCQEACEVFILDYPHNRDHQIPDSIKRIHTLEDFIKEL